MTLRARGISEKVVFAYNPLPDVGEDELFKADRLNELFEPGIVSPFSFTWKYGGGLQQETVHLRPGDFLPLRESEAAEFIQSTNATELGLVVLPDQNITTPKNRKLILAALMNAAKFYNQHGAAQIMKQRKVHNYTEEDIFDLRAQYHSYFINKAKELAIRAEIERLRKPGSAKAA